jgi:undecaprenyl-diphosphatase
MEALWVLPWVVKALILGVVEGLTEFLPISSTGHLILVGSLLGWHDEKAKVFDIAIQTGAMLAVMVYYRARLRQVVTGLGSNAQARRFVRNLVIAFAPAAVLGVLFGRVIKQFLFAPVPVAMAFIVGGIVILWVERRAAGAAVPTRIDDLDALTARDALVLGLAQAVSLIPGTSRSGATIIGGMLWGLSRRAATEFSFFLAMPTLIGAGAYQLWRHRHDLSWGDGPVFAVGLVAAFFSALACVHWLIRYVSRHNFVPFAWYRIVFGLLVLLTAARGWVDWTGA